MCGTGMSVRCSRYLNGVLERMKNRSAGLTGKGECELLNGSHFALKLLPRLVQGRFDRYSHNPNYAIVKLDKEANVEAAVLVSKNVACHV